MKKQRVTVWPDGRVTTSQYGEVHPAKVSEDMGNERFQHAASHSTVSVEEIGVTLVVTKESGTVHVYTWAP